MRFRLSSRALLALSLCASAGLGLSARAATLVLVNNTLGDNSFDVVGVSNDGTRVAGTASTFVELEQGVAVSYDRPFFWQSGTIQTLGVPKPDNVGSAYATGLASEVALVVGSAPFGSPYTDERGFLWTPIDAYGDAGAPGISAARAYAVSSNGSFIVGSYSLLGINRPFYAGNGEPRDLGALVGNTTTVAEAMGISDDGTHIVGASHTGVGPAVAHAVLWPSGGAPTDLGALGGENSANVNSYALDVSLDGTRVVGASYVNAVSNQTHAVLWDHGTVRDIGELGIGSVAQAISSDGKLVVGFSGTQAILWDDVHGLRQLRQLLLDLEVNLDGWIALGAAKAVGFDGTRYHIAGNGTRLVGDTQVAVGFVASLTPAELGLATGGGGDGEVGESPLKPFLGTWHVTGFEHEVFGSPKPTFAHRALPFVRLEVSEPVSGTLRLVLKNAKGATLETVDRAFLRDGDSIESVETVTESTGRERSRLRCQFIREGLVLAHELGAFFALDDGTVWDAWGFAAVLTRDPLPKSDASLWAGPYAGREWFLTTGYDSENSDYFLDLEGGELSLAFDKSGTAYRYTADYASDEETDTGVAKPSGSFLSADFLEKGGLLWTHANWSTGTRVFDQGKTRVVQVSPRELVALGLSGELVRVAPLPPATFTAYHQLGYADSNILYLESTATYVREGQTVSLPAPAPGPLGVFKAKGLPSGLVIDPATGAISGHANVKPGNYAITRTAAGFTDTVYLRVEAFPADLLANPYSPSKLVYNEYEALLRAPLDSTPVGKVTLKLAASGLFSGTLTTGSLKADSLKGRFVPSADGTTAAAALALPGGRTLHLSLDADGLDAELEGTEGVTLGAFESGVFSGRVRLYTATSPAPGGLAKGTVPYTLAISSPEGSETAPTGHGWATATINTAGALSLTGKLADGRTLTGTLRATDAGYLPYLKPYDKLADAYLSGRLRLSAREGGGYHVAGGEGFLVWSKPAPLNPSDRVPVFGPVSVSARLEPWPKIVTTEEFAARLGITSSSIAVVLNNGFTETDPARVLPELLSFAVTKGKFASGVTSPVLVEGSTAAAISANTKAWANIWKLSVDLSKGTFAGELYLTDSVPVPTKPDTRKNVTRKVPFSGVLLARGEGWPFAFGHYVVTSLEKNGASLGGRIELSATSE